MYFIWCVSLVVVYTTLIYPFLVFMLARLKHKSPRPETYFHSGVSIVIPVHNAENYIDLKVRNLLSINYPREMLEIIFVSDGSTDGTIESLARHEGVKVVVSPLRIGKERALKKAISYAANDIICLTDVATEMNVDGLKELVAHMESPLVGAASSVDGIDKDSYVLERLLLRFENGVRLNESINCSSVALSGSFFVTRKKIFESLPGNCASDFAVALECFKQGFVTVVDKNAIGYYRKSSSIKIEFDRKTRTVIHGVNTLFKYRELLNFFRYGMFSWQLLSHKILRWIMPVSLLALFVITIVTLAGHVRFEYLVAIGVAVLPAFLWKNVFAKNFILLIVYNFAVVSALFNVVMGRVAETWEPTKRDVE